MLTYFFILNTGLYTMLRLYRNHDKYWHIEMVKLLSNNLNHFSLEFSSRLCQLSSSSSSAQTSLSHPEEVPFATSSCSSPKSNRFPTRGCFCFCGEVKSESQFTSLHPSPPEDLSPDFFTLLSDFLLFFSVFSSLQSSHSSLLFDLDLDDWSGASSFSHASNSSSSLSFCGLFFFLLSDGASFLL